MLLILSLLCIFLTACTTSDLDEDSESDEIIEPIVIGTVSGNTPAAISDIAIEVLEKEGYEVEKKVFNDYNSPNSSVSDGSLQYNFFQHLPFLEAFNESNDTDLVPIGNGVYTQNFGIYSHTVEHLDEIEEGMVVAIHNDNSNRRTSLRMLEEAGLIKLKEDVEMPTQLDIVENPKKIEFVEVEGTMIPSVYQDVDLACSASAFWQNADQDLNDAIFTIKDEEGVVYLVTSSGNEDSATSKLLEKAFTSQEVKDFIEEEFKGVAEPVF